ncbi:MAG TPA: trehalose-phosphatase [Euzebyales bacterium]|nr:trehalose-phosphatase [Euzebyales bacterium]
MTSARTILALPHALDDVERLRTRLDGRTPAIFLDYDGVLTPIVDDPAAATLSRRGRHAVERAAEHVPVSVISGRDLEDVRAMVDVGGLAYAGSHGFDMLLPDGERERYGEEFLDALDEAEQRLRTALDGTAGVAVERKQFAIAVHTRLAPGDEQRRQAHRAVADAAEGSARLRVTGGKNVEELRPAIAWDKGRALTRLMEVLDLDESTHAPIYVGDDVTDEDAFAVIVDAGIGVVVAGDEDRDTRAALRLDDPAETAQLLDLVVSLSKESHR